MKKRDKTRPPEDIRGPSLGEFSKSAQRKAVTKRTLTHEATVWPVTLGIISIIGGTLILPGLPILVFIGGGGIFAGIIAWFVNWGLRGEQLECNYIAELNERVMKANEAKKRNVRNEIESCSMIIGAEEFVRVAMKQFDTADVAFNDMSELLNEKLKVGEMAFGVFFDGANQIVNNILDNLKTVFQILKAISSIDVEDSERRLENLNGRETSDESSERAKKSIIELLEHRTEKLRKIRDLLSLNDEAITKLEKVTGDIVEMDTGGYYASMTLEEAMQKVQWIADVSKDYKSD
ncbi:hypothetical protein HQ571_04265 [Candidatus Kuenenbacteria bacterium]|nr:hypothetical protein [Candidatus Kuenenbacteria bacterium]